MSQNDNDGQQKVKPRCGSCFWFEPQERSAAMGFCYGGIPQVTTQMVQKPSQPKLTAGGKLQIVQSAVVDLVPVSITGRPNIKRTDRACPMYRYERSDQEDSDVDKPSG